MKVLIADDDIALTHMLTARLKAIGFKPITAQDAVQAWLAVQRNVPSVVVLDLHMPGGTGKAVLKSLKMSAKTQHIPVIVISSLSEQEVRSELTALGAESFLLKPLDLASFDREVERLSGLRESVGNEKSATQLPVLPPETTAPKTKQQRSGASPVSSPKPVTGEPQQPMKVLVAEDDPATLHVLESLLPGWDYRVVSAKNGQEALKHMESPEPPQIAVLDWIMPVHDGLEVCAEIRRRASDFYTYIVMLTAKAHKNELVKAMEAGADDYIVKPFDAGELKVRLAAGRRIVELQDDLLSSRAQLRSALQLLSTMR